MATVHVALGRVGARADTGSTLPILNSVPRAAETLTSSGVSTAGELTALAEEVWTLVVAGGDVFVAFGADPQAARGAGHLLLAGQSRDYAVTTAGEKLALIDA